MVLEAENAVVSPFFNPGLMYRNVYLFIAPIKTTKVESNVQFSFNDLPYFWSLDSTGALPMTKQTQKLLGLPSYRAVVENGMQWNAAELSAVSYYIKSKGFNPKSLDYAQAQHYPIFEALDDNDFEVIDCSSK